MSSKNEFDTLLEKLDQRVTSLELARGASPPVGPAAAVWKMIRRTTLIEAPQLHSMFGVKRLVIASETLQHTGSFKFRAAFNLASSVSHQKILTASSGNFGQVFIVIVQMIGAIRC
jgi:threonine dehydratase